MSTDLRDRTSQPSPDEGPGAPDKPKASLSVAQVVGGALAAMTAAALGSRLSVAGTVVGAALASVVAALASAVYTSSLRRTHERVSAVWKGRGQATAAAAAQDRAAWWGEQPGETSAQPPVDPGTVGRPAAEEQPPPQVRRSRISWKPVLVAALLMFAIAAVALTGIELTTGHALSGGTGTTVGRVAERSDPSTGAPSSRTSSTPTAAPGSASPTPSASASGTVDAEPTAEPSASTSSEPSAAPSASSSAVPSTNAVPTPAETSASAAPAPSAPAAG